MRLATKFAPKWATCMLWKHEGKTGPLWFSDGRNKTSAYETDELGVQWFTPAQSKRIAAGLNLPLEQA